MRSPRLRRNPPPATAAAAAPAPDQFRPGDLVEVLPDEPGYRGAHFPASVTASHANPRGYTVAYDGSGCPLGEVVAASQLRPRPPDAPRGVPPAEHAVVDAFKGGAWWVGVALGGGRAAAGGRVAVCFPETREVVEFDAADVRPHLEWVAGEWLSPENMVQFQLPISKLTKCTQFCEEFVSENVSDFVIEIREFGEPVLLVATEGDRLEMHWSFFPHLLS